MGKQWKHWLYFGTAKSLQMVTAIMKLKDAYSWKKSYDQPSHYIKKQRHYFADKDSSSQSYGFSGSHVWIWELNYKDSKVLNNWCFWIVVLEMTLESPLNQSWIFIEGSDAEAKIPILWPHDVKNWLTGKDPDAGKDQRREEKGRTEVEMVGWHHWLNGH